MTTHHRANVGDMVRIGTRVRDPRTDRPTDQWSYITGRVVAADRYGFNIVRDDNGKRDGVFAWPESGLTHLRIVEVIR